MNQRVEALVSTHEDLLRAISLVEEEMLDVLNSEVELTREESNELTNALYRS